MSTWWVHGGTTPPCPCGAASEDQVRRPDGGDRSHWFCLVCQRGRPHDPGGVDELIPVGEQELRAHDRAMAARGRQRGEAAEAASNPGSALNLD